MVLRLYSHPLSSFSHKVLIPLYENDTPFEPIVVDFGDPASLAAFKAVWPMGKMPALVDTDRGETVAESSIVIEYLDRHHRGAVRFLPDDPDLARKARFWDRFFDFHVHILMQQIVGDRLRPEGKSDPTGVEKARRLLRDAYGVIETRMAGRTWAMGDTFGIADCSAAPALFYADTAEPIGDQFPETKAYLLRLCARPSYRRVLKEARPYFRYFPLEKKPVIPEA
ncbi:glutathione S-transferase family protein [Oryzicola mucosus]|uniref:Glutathione S-transferase family protein n=1 Tax=Oryzicola mucosus TaxID=2767425 RepID=A0A8J6PHS9_9HYPH|nr:glutathione S-transferase family protein [Oryzicola mucosus]MBD0414333.1 glutathione S-transferase family protein [Oryzicola mucosus]